MRLSARARRKLVAATEERLSRKTLRDYDHHVLHFRNEYLCQRLRQLREKYPGGVKGELMARPLRGALKCLLGNDDGMLAPFEYKMREHKVKMLWPAAVYFGRPGSASEFADRARAIPKPADPMEVD